jgi:UDP-N-acetylmuramyl tripeptide synthase
VLVSGTNGKTSVTALTVAAIGDTVGVASNTDGANTGAGLAGVLLEAVPDRLVLEVDEAWLPWAIDRLRPEVVVLVNLSRDQLSRHHEVRRLASTWRTALAGVPLVVATTDDPGVVWAALAARRQVWVAAGALWHADSQVCPACGSACLLSGTSWSCSSCDLTSPRPHWWLHDRELRDDETSTELRVGLPGRFNLANAALAVVAARESAGVSFHEAVERVAEVRSVAGRYERVHYRGHDLRILLAKNPAGWLELLDVLGGETCPLLLLLNADGVDGRDPSWLYDVSFATLRHRTVLVQGRRATDLLVRLQLDGVMAQQVPGPVAEALRRLPAGRVDVVGNYTAFRRVLDEVRHG